MKNIILHIPHSSTSIPFYDGYLVDETQLKEEQLLLTDWYTEDLFHHKDGIAVIAAFSRLFCDVERFVDDSEEIMSKVGMGVLYSKRDDGTPLRRVTPELRTRIINDYFRPNHKKLTKAVDSQLKQYGRAIIIDCHSFPDVPLRRDLSQNPDRPDFNIGTDNFHTSDELLKKAQRFFEKKNLTVGINTPYTGTIVPLKFYLKNRNVQSIMLEVNRRLYLEPYSSTKLANYPRVKETVIEFIASIFESADLS